MRKYEVEFTNGSRCLIEADTYEIALQDIADLKLQVATLQRVVEILMELERRRKGHLM